MNNSILQENPTGWGAGVSSSTWGSYQHPALQGQHSQPAVGKAPAHSSQLQCIAGTWPSQRAEWSRALCDRLFVVVFGGRMGRQDQELITVIMRSYRSNRGKPIMYLHCCSNGV